LSNATFEPGDVIFSLANSHSQMNRRQRLIGNQDAVSKDLDLIVSGFASK